MVFNNYIDIFLHFLTFKDEVISSSGQVEPPGMHMIYLPFSDDIRHVEEVRKLGSLHFFLASHSN